MKTKKSPSLPSLTWIADNGLSDSLHAATWLETTKTLRQLGWQVDLLSHNEGQGVRGIRCVEVRFFRSRMFSSFNNFSIILRSFGNNNPA